VFILKRLFTVLSSVVILCGVISGCVHSSLKPIDEIYIYFSGFGMTFPEYKIDLTNKKFWEFQYSGDYSDFTTRDETAQNEGFTFVRDLEDDKIQAFLKDAEAVGFADWKKEYDNPNVLDGLQWVMTINYADGSQKQIWGSNAFPGSWEKMKPIFMALTDKEILIGSNKEYNH
jgi:hypothetical protein